MNAFTRLTLCTAMMAALAGCASTTQSQSGTPSNQYVIGGIAGDGQSLAQVSVYDAQGKHTTVSSDAHGRFKASLQGFQAPLMLVAQTGPKQYLAIDAHPETGVANVNALTDRIASDIALDAKFQGPAGMAQSGKAPAIREEALAAKTATLRASLGDALKAAGVADVEHFDPVSARMDQARGISEVLGIIKHNRGYSSATGESGETSLYDPLYREITPFHPLQLADAQASIQRISAPGTVRVFIAGDSTASNYDPEVAPRMGWGQAFERQLKAGSAVQVLNVAQSGRSSRSFINEGWFGMIAADIRQGDYLLVQFGHNDEKCGNEPPAPAPSRDQVDLGNLCTYPGDNAAIPAEMSFRKTLEKYIAMARKAGATPVLITPVTRRNFKGGAISGTTHTYGKGKFPGDYAQTVRETATANQIAFVDLDARSMAFFNQVGEQNSLDYYLAVDTSRYPYYLNKTGSRNKPDNTHFQEKGAEAVSGLVAAGIKDLNLPLAQALR